MTYVSANETIDTKPIAVIITFISHFELAAEIRKLPVHAIHSFVGHRFYSNLAVVL
jgi:hypothetical protein